MEIHSTAYASYLKNMGACRDVKDMVTLFMEQGQSITTPTMLGVALTLAPDTFREWHEGLVRELTGGENEDTWYDLYGELLIPPVFARLIELMEAV